MWRIRVGMRRIRVGMQEIRMGMRGMMRTRGIMVRMRKISVGNTGNQGRRSTPVTGRVIPTLAQDPFHLPLT